MSRAPAADEIRISSPDKVYFPDSGITKGDVVRYYRRIADRMLPYMADHPVAMLAFPKGIAGPSYFRKDVPDHFPDWIERVTLPKRGGSTTYVLCQNAASLVYIANQNTLTPHLLLAPAATPWSPDRLVIDLDPSDDDFGKVREAAHRIRELLGELELPSFVMTSGSRGLHLWTPLDGSAPFEVVSAFAAGLAAAAARRHPDLLTDEFTKADRGSRVYVDHLRNTPAQHAVAPYATRPREGAPVACPVAWDEVTSRLTPTAYTIGNLFRRLGQVDDPWAGIFDGAVDLASRTDRLDGLGEPT